MTAFDGADLPEHGGRLRAAAQHWGIPPEQWLDLSTGINPVPWPVPAIPAEVWQRLPEPEDGLEEIIRIWAGAPERACCLPVAGSQAAIMALPAVRARKHGFGRVAVPCPVIVSMVMPGGERVSTWWRFLNRRQCKRSWHGWILWMWWSGYSRIIRPGS